MPSSSIAVARWVSIVGHPFIVVPLTVALVSRSIVTTGVLIGVLVIMMLVVVRKVRSGEWSDFDVSLLEQRPGAYARAIPLMAAAWLFLWVVGGRSRGFWGFGVAIGILLMATLLTRLRLKASMHAAFDSYAAVLPSAVMPALAGALALLALWVAWSRVVLRRHTTLEVLVGAALGVTGGALLVWLR
jgi:hypothetical protein